EFMEISNVVDTPIARAYDRNTRSIVSCGHAATQSIKPDRRTTRKRQQPLRQFSLNLLATCSMSPANFPDSKQGHSLTHFCSTSKAKSSAGRKLRLTPRTGYALSRGRLRRRLLRRARNKWRNRRLRSLALRDRHIVRICRRIRRGRGPHGL